MPLRFFVYFSFLFLRGRRYNRRGRQEALLKTDPEGIEILKFNFPLGYSFSLGFFKYNNYALFEIMRFSAFC